MELSDDELDLELIAVFLAESLESLDQYDRDLLTLEADPTAGDVLANIFRTIHTIKGTCSFMGYTKLEAVTHVGENLLSRLRDNQLAVTPAVTSALLAIGDAVREMLQTIGAEGHDGLANYGHVIQTVSALQTGATAALKPVAPPLPAPVSDLPSLATPDRPATPDRAAPAPPIAEHTVRLPIGLLDTLMSLAGELVLARNQVQQVLAAHPDVGLTQGAQRLNLVTSELRQAVMKARMQPIDTIWGKFPRLVRDLALSCAKPVQLEVDGADTELDRTLLEAIKDPLTHLLRNAIDHGIEASEVRRRLGKPEVSRLKLAAVHDSGHVTIRLQDDGGGMDPERLRQRAVQRGLITPETAAALGNREALGLIFLPGFSTAEQVTNISGRGVGMDVVKTNIERIGGTVEVQSLLGEGTTFTLRLPLTLAIIPALIISAGGERFAVPQLSLVELARLENQQARPSVETVHGVPVYRLRNKRLPLVHLGHVLALSPDDLPAADLLNIVVLRVGQREFGLVVDGVHDAEEIVVQPLDKLLTPLSCFSGTTIRGDGDVVLILDVAGLAGRANLGPTTATADPETLPAGAGAGRRSARQPLLIFAGPDGGQLAVALTLVSRLEKIPPAAIEQIGNQTVVQYRGQIIPVVRLAALLTERRSRPRRLPAQGPEAEAPLCQMVVFTESDHSVGLVVDRILDIVDGADVPTFPAGRPGVIGSVVLQGKVTELLDHQAVFRAALPAGRRQDQPTTAEV